MFLLSCRKVSRQFFRRFHPRWSHFRRMAVFGDEWNLSNSWASTSSWQTRPSLSARVFRNLWLPRSTRILSHPQRSQNLTQLWIWSYPRSSSDSHATTVCSRWNWWGSSVWSYRRWEPTQPRRLWGWRPRTYGTHPSHQAKEVGKAVCTGQALESSSDTPQIDSVFIHVSFSQK